MVAGAQGVDVADQGGGSAAARRGALWQALTFCLAANSPLRAASETSPLNLSALRNPVWVSEDNLRDPAVLPVDGGYLTR